jgi:hypothetical protein
MSNPDLSSHAGEKASAQTLGVAAIGYNITDDSHRRTHAMRGCNRLELVRKPHGMRSMKRLAKPAVLTASIKTGQA